MIKKFVVGIRPASKMFRVVSGWGEIADHILGARGSKTLPEDYYTHIRQAEGAQVTTFVGEQNGNELRLTPDNVVFIKNQYSNTGGVNMDRALREFAEIYRLLDKILPIRDVRRIGLVAEMRFWPKSKDPSRELFDKITSFRSGGIKAKFNLSIERRYPSNSVIQFDSEKDDFVNIIWNIYDSQLDRDKSDVEAFNVNCDVQKYYTPSFNGDLVKEVNALRKKYQTEVEETLQMLKGVGLLEVEK
jgi:hypothetical protein